MTGQPPRTARRKMFLILCGLYAALGTGCFVAGLYLLNAANHASGAGELRSVGAIKALAGVLILFGVWRTGLALFHARRIVRLR